MAPKVPLFVCRPFRRNKALPYYKRAASRAGFYPWTPRLFTTFAGPLWVWSLKRFQRANGILPTGIYGINSHDELRHGYRKGHAPEMAFGAYEIAQLLALLPRPIAAEAIVSRFYQWWAWAVEHQAEIHYRQDRPCLELRDRVNPPRLPMVLDCSDTVLYFAWLAGSQIIDTVNGWSGLGNTDSLIGSLNGFRISESEIDRYAKDHIVCAFYWHHGGHVVACQSSGLIYSNGQESAPERRSSIHYRDDLRCVIAFRVAA